ncbi:hypothetical protein B0H13DRAFT_1900393 [Mycena leptocephala]|nr:hypothetical protein B0H13DRAFT_1900393 [Mycena leptocephala]
MAQTWLPSPEILDVRLAQLGQCQGLPRRAHVHNSHERGVGFDRRGRASGIRSPSRFSCSSLTECITGTRTLNSNGLRVSDIPGAATHEGGEIVPASDENTSAHLEATTNFPASLHGDFEGKALVLAIQGETTISSIFPPHSVGDFATVANNDTTWMSRRKQRKICGKPLELPKADPTAERGEKIGGVDISLRVPPQWPRPNSQGSGLTSSARSGVGDDAKQDDRLTDARLSIVLRKPPVATAVRSASSSSEVLRITSRTRRVGRYAYRAIKTARSSPSWTRVRVRFGSGAKSVAVLVASKLEATAWNDFPNMGSFSRALALAEYVDLLYIFAACTTAPRFPFVYRPATANVSRADGLLKSIRIGMGASLADGGPARQELLLTQQNLYGHESCGGKVNWLGIATIPTADGGPPVLYTVSVGVNDLIRRNPRTGNIFLEELRKCEVDCAITRVLRESGAIKPSCDNCVQFDRQLSPELVDLGRDMRRERNPWHPQLGRLDERQEAGQSASISRD